MKNIFFNSSSYLVGMIESVLETNIHLHGEENLLKDSPTLFVSNHFTRFETFVMPYIIDTYAHMSVRSLADHSIFVGYYSKYLDRVGTVSTQNPQRNEIILGDLMTGRDNWIIYPEGVMVKNKKISKDKEFMLHIDHENSAVRTGSAVLAMMSELLKREFKEAQRAGDIIKVRTMREKYFISPAESMAYKNSVVVPVNITYTPLRAGVNSLMGLGDRFVEPMDARLKEELEIEGNILLNSEIHIRFDKPIDIAEYLYHVQNKMGHLNKPLGELAISSPIRHDLTTRFMDAIYKNIMINFDHIFALVLEYYSEEFVRSSELKRAIYLAAKKVDALKTYHLHHSITDALYKLLTDEQDPWFESVLALALEQKVLVRVEEELYKINKEVYAQEHDFHTIRIKNTLRVILNEVSLFSNVILSVKDTLGKTANEIKEEVFYAIYHSDQKRYTKAYNAFYSVILSKPKEIGAPFVLYNPDFSTGIVISHGYTSSPSEIKELSLYLHERGINVYGVRLEGHGTLSEDMRESSWEEWYDSFNRGFAAMRQVSKKLFVAGFSTGGLLAILATVRKLNKVEGLIVINAALELQDIRMNYVVPTLNRMNDFLSFFNADMEYVESEPEFPEFNYARSYIKSLNQLYLLMQACSASLPLVTAPALVLQADKDPVVKPESAQKIMEKINSKQKELKMLPFSRHVIVLGEGKNEVFEKVYAFIQGLAKTTLR
jgi:esterase/lipase/1-acyl-sn-glycerol-3-phosphate acyltransferase